MSGERLRIVDFSTHMSGPIASHLLAELGADVIKIERPGVGDGNRGDHPAVLGQGMFHVALNSGTRSLAISTRSPHWRTVVEASARWADAVIVGTRPSAARKRGLDFASMHKANPRIVYCLISGYGERGPWRDYSAHGQTIDAFAGLATHEVVDGQPVTPDGWRSTGSTLSGVFGAMGVLAGILRRDRTGTAQHINVSLWGAAMWWQWRDLTTLANLDIPWRDYRNLGSRYAMYPTADDRVVLAAPIEQRFWEQFCDLLELPADWKSRGDWSTSGMDFGNGERYADEPALITERMRSRTMPEWWEAFGATDIPFAPLLTPAEALDSDHARMEGILRSTSVGDGTARVTATPIRFADDELVESEDRVELPPLSPPPGLGEHTEEVLGALGLAIDPAELVTDR